MQVVSTVPELKDTLRLMRTEDKTIGLVPTMGYLHAGHEQLIKTARQSCDIVVVSIFVNPLQFAANEDLAKYPRDLEHDSRLCNENQVDILFIPEVTEITPANQLSFVNITELDKYLCGASRPGHFRGVCTIVSKLFNLIQPTRAFFGQKDIQQLKIIQKMTDDLNFPVEIVGVETHREADGLAMSSRNSYLNPVERKAAIVISQGLNLAAKLIKSQDYSAEQILRQTYEYITQEPLAHIDYLEIVSESELKPTNNLKQDLIVAAAVFIGKTRLIDNLTIYYSNNFISGENHVY